MRHYFARSVTLVLGVLLAAPGLASTYRWAGSSNRIYVEGPGTSTLTQIDAALPAAPLSSSGATWTLGANLILNGGARLDLHGTAIGGDVDELRLKSDAGGYVLISAEPGTLDIDHTTIRSWDGSASGPDTAYADGRAYIRVRSMLAADGVTPLESRMDIRNSDISYLGFNGAEAYGLVWKVTGSPGADFSLYDQVNVYGDIAASHIHHNYYGIYTFGLQGGHWQTTEFDHNVGYGVDPHDDSDDLLIEHNNVHDNGFHGIIASKRCDHPVIRNNHSWNNAECGIMLHRSSNDGVIADNIAENNADCGIALFATARTQVTGNHLLGNTLYGIRLSMGAEDNVVDGNEIADNGRYQMYFYQGSDVPEPGSDGRNRRNQFLDNDVHDAPGSAIKLSDSDDTEFTGNSFVNVGHLLEFVAGQGTTFANNAVPASVTWKLTGSNQIPTDITLSEQPRVPLSLGSDTAAHFRDPANAIFDSAFSMQTSAAAGPGGSRLDLTDADLAGATTIYTRDFKAVPSAGSVSVDVTAWGTSRAWSSKVGATGGTIAWTVGELTPGKSYDVFRAATKIATRVANTAGRIAFATRELSTATQAYSVKPTP
jgi:poly(beta-D-mannuronate) C5 epimerase